MSVKRDIIPTKDVDFTDLLDHDIDLDDSLIRSDDEEYDNDIEETMFDLDLLANSSTEDILESSYNDLLEKTSKLNLNYYSIFDKQVKNIKAYPMEFNDISLERYNLNKWIDTLREIYSQEKKGLERFSAISSSLNNWNLKEKIAFLQWLKYYEGGDHLKYKKADYYQDSSLIFQNRFHDSQEARDDNLELSKSERKRIIESYRKKIIARLDSAERLLRSEDGAIFAGDSLEALMEKIFDLKKKVNLANKRASSFNLSYLIKEAGNNFVKSGDLRSGGFFISLAQDMAESIESEMADVGPDTGDSALGAAEPQPVTGGGGASGGDAMMGGGDATIGGGDSALSFGVPGNQPMDAVYQGGPPIELDQEEEEERDPADLFLNQLNSAGIYSFDSMASSINKNAQDSSNFDRNIDELLNKVTVSDVILKLENLSKVFKIREIPRQLAMVDMMLDSLGLATYFPALSEATNKSLESNNYISTRVDDVLSKLQGALKTEDIDLTGHSNRLDEKAKIIRETLEKNQILDEERKEMRRQKEIENLVEEKEVPEIEITDDSLEGGEQQPMLLPAQPTQQSLPKLTPQTKISPDSNVPILGV